MNKTATQLWTEAKAAFKRRDYEVAEELLETILHDHERVPGLAPGALELEYGVVLLRLGHTQAGVNALERATARAPGDARAWQKLGLGFARLGHDLKALEHLERAATMAPDNAEYQWRLGEQFRRLGRTEEARAAFERALVLEPGHELATEGLEHLKAKRGSWLARVAKGLRRG